MQIKTLLADRERQTDDAKKKGDAVQAENERARGLEMRLAQALS